MTYTLTLDGLALHHYGQGVYGWGPTSSTTGQPGRLVEWVMRAEAERWMQARAVFCAGAQVQAMSGAPDEPAFLDDDDPDAPLPTFVSTTNAYELYGLREGETVSEAIARALTPGELEDLRQDMQASSEWARKELARRKQER